jgi:2,3-bisphosphoglycerate-independent phosphoglycerate mutase
MKYVLAVGDGMADVGVEQLGGLTPLEYAKTPNMDALASMSQTGLAKTTPDGIAPGTDTAFYSIMGYNVRTQFTGRSPMEAAGMGVMLREGETAFRCNLAAITEDEFEQTKMVSHAGGQIPAEDGAELMDYLKAQPEFAAMMAELDMLIHTGTGFRHTAVINGKTSVELQKALPVWAPPHDIVGQSAYAHLPKDPCGIRFTQLSRKSYELLSAHPINAARRAKGQAPANCIWLWGQGTKPNLEKYDTKYGITGKVISAVPIVSGIGVLAGLEPVAVEGATGELDTNYVGKAAAAVKALSEGADFALVHVEAPDECAHAGSVEDKVEAVARFDKMIGRLKKGLDALEEDYRLLILSDHLTKLSTRTHSAEPVPFLLFDSRSQAKRDIRFNETDAAKTGVFIEDASTLMARLLEQYHDA